MAGFQIFAFVAASPAKQSLQIVSNNSKIILVLLYLLLSPRNLQLSFIAFYKPSDQFFVVEQEILFGFCTVLGSSQFHFPCKNQSFAGEHVLLKNRNVKLSTLPDKTLQKSHPAVKLSLSTARKLTVASFLQSLNTKHEI